MRTLISDTGSSLPGSFVATRTIVDTISVVKKETRGLPHIMSELEEPKFIRERYILVAAIVTEIVKVVRNNFDGEKRKKLTWSK